MSLAAPCTGRLCEYGDVLYDEDCDPLAYDGSECRCRRCPNFSVCSAWSPQPLCLTCRSLFGVELEDAGTAECPVCLLRTACVGHPAGCGHALCGPCLMALSATENEQPLPSEYGFERGCACEDEDAAWGTHECDECSEALQAWEQTEQGMLWVEACVEASSDDSPMRRCPLCRASR